MRCLKYSLLNAILNWFNRAHNDIKSILSRFRLSGRQLSGAALRSSYQNMGLCNKQMGKLEEGKLERRLFIPGDFFGLPVFPLNESLNVFLLHL